MPAALVLPLVVAVAFVAWCLADLRAAPSVRYLPKWGWAIVCVVSIPIGGLVYLLVGRADR